MHDSRFDSGLEAVDEAGRGNVTVYDGFAPFAGHGLRFTASPATSELVAEMRTLLRRHRAELPDAVDEVAEELRDELDSTEPDRGAVARTLDRLNIMVRPIAPLVETVGELTKVVDLAFRG